MAFSIILIFIAILIGMAISVTAFGIGGKRAKIFRDIYFSVEDVDGVGVLYTKTGEDSAILAMQNPVQKFCANIDSYYEYSSLMAAVMATLGDGYAIHKQEMGKLAKKKNRHASLPNPSNQIAVEDIKQVEELIARENKQLVYCHFNLIITTGADANLQKCTNHLENAFGRIGIHISQRAYNQLELFVNSFPGNCYGLNAEYDRFLTLSDAACCMMYKERMTKSEDTPLKLYYTDRQGVPVAIDISGKEGREKLTDNSNFFCLGPSGSGKSFHMNSSPTKLGQNRPK